MKRLMPLALILVIVLVGALAVSPVLGGNHGIEGAKKAQKGLNDQVLSNGDVVGTAVGLKDGEAVLRVFTAKPGVAGIPKKHDGFDVLVQVTGRINVLPPRAEPGKSGSSEFTSRVVQSAQDTFARPVPIGVSTGNERLIKYRGRWWCTVGTLAARVVDGDGNVFALSNNHVYALENDAVIGDKILQPGRVDMPSGGCGSSTEIAAAEIGTLDRYERIDFGGNNTIDAALAATTTGDLGNATPPEGYGLPNSATVDATFNMLVQKYGRTTELTHGKVTNISATVNVGYNGGMATFVDQIIVESAGAFIQGGDSGSLLVTDDGSANPNPVGLLFAGNSSGTFSIANDIDAVLSKFGVTIDGAVSATGSVSGNVTNAGDDSGIQGGSVSVDTGQSTTTGLNGAYTIVDVPTGDRTVTASADGYVSGVQPATVADNPTTTVDFALTAMPVDETPPVISVVEHNNVTANSATITWTTDESANSTVYYGLDANYGSSADDLSLVTSHSINLTGLAAETTYHYQVTSVDASDNPSSSGDFTFMTAAAPDVATTVSVTSIDYATEGGKEQDKHLLITLTLQNDLGGLVAGASVTIDLYRTGDGIIASGTGTTGGDGTLTFSLKNAKAGAYTTTVTDVTADGLTWDELTPPNDFTKTGGSKGNSDGLSQ